MFTMQILTGTLAAIFIHPWTEFTAGGANGVNHAAGGAMVFTICMFVVGFAFSWGPLGWLVCNPIYYLPSWPCFAASPLHLACAVASILALHPCALMPVAHSPS